ncbi:hypothetical protein KAW65_08505 [candidate division WOR-3 bacterium]|nr:hypothetical protein [candidate division WOR-3 bacterium]
MIKVSVPNMNVVPIVVKPVFEELGYEFIAPPKMSRKTIEEGAKYAPEFACFPLKAVLGDFILASRKGAEYLVIFGGTGPCRFGWYGSTLQIILKNLGIPAKVFVLDFPTEKWARDTFSILGINGSSVKKLIHSGLIALKKLRLIELAQELARKIRPFEVKIGESDKTLQKIYKIVDNENSFIRLMKMKNEIKLMFEGINKNSNHELIRIGLVGELYMCLQEELNMWTESKLGKLGAFVDRSAIGLWKYVTGDIGLNFAHRRAKRIAYPWLKWHAGGESIYSIGYSLIFERKGYDGVVHISPLGCMPEIVAQTIMEKCVNIPILNLVFDEHTGETGVNTRLEAFCDLLKLRKE